MKNHQNRFLEEELLLSFLSDKRSTKKPGLHLKPQAFLKRDDKAKNSSFSLSFF